MLYSVQNVVFCSGTWSFSHALTLLILNILPKKGSQLTHSQSWDRGTAVFFLDITVTYRGWKGYSKNIFRFSYLLPVKKCSRLRNPSITVMK